jgi:hypothetical protein
MIVHMMLAGLAGLAVAQFPPIPQGVTVLQSKFHENVTISYKEARSKILKAHWRVLTCL